MSSPAGTLAEHDTTASNELTEREFVDSEPKPDVPGLKLDGTPSHVQVFEVGSEDPAVARLSLVRRSILLALFCLAQFLDVFNFAAIIVAIPAISKDLSISTADAVWVISAFQLTFAAFLLVSGRVSDIYDPKHCFIVGTCVLGALSLGCGFVRSMIGLFVLRALTGIGASLTIPSALGLIIRFFPEPNSQAIALGAFGGSGAVGAVLGVIISAAFVQYTSWSWVFWFSAIIALPISLVCALLIPTQREKGRSATLKSLDVFGVSILTAALVLFIYALTTGPSAGWSSAKVLAPLLISVFLVVAFLYWETRIPRENASLPPHIWFYPNFAVLFGMALSPYLWWTTGFLLFSSLWQDIFGWSSIKSGVHFLPMALASLPLTVFAGYITRLARPKWIILLGGVMGIASNALLPFAGRADHYWRIAFPGLVLGTMSATLVYTGTSVAMFQTTPPELAGTVGAIFNAALQLGAAVGSAAVTAIQTSVETRRPEDPAAGRAAGWWFLFAVFVLQTVAVAAFYRLKDVKSTMEEVETERESAKMGEAH